MARKTGTFLAVAALALGLAEPALGADEGDVAPAAQPPVPADPISQVTQGVGATVQQTAAPVTEVVQDTVQQTTQATAPVTRVVQETVQQTTAPVTQAVQETAAPVTQTVRETTNAVRETARPVVDRTTDTVTRTVSPVADEADHGAADRRTDSPAPSSSDPADPTVPPLRGGASSQREGQPPHATPEESTPAPRSASRSDRDEVAAPQTPRLWDPVTTDAPANTDLAVQPQRHTDGGASAGTRSRRDASDGYSGHSGHGGPSVAGASAVAASAAGSGPMLLLAFIGLCFGAACVLRRLQLVQITRSGDAFSLLLERPG